MSNLISRSSAAGGTLGLRCLLPACPFVFLGLTGLLTAVPCRAAETVFPGPQWTEAMPESQGVNSAKLKEAAELLARTVGADGSRELIVIRHGRMIYRGDDIDKRHGVWSATKSFTSTVLGLLIADGKCTLDTRVADVLPELKAHYPDVTLRHFTTMTSGYRAVGDETTGSYKHGPSSTPFVPNSKPLFAPPGSQYAYWDSAMNTFALALTKIAGEPIEQYFKRRVADPIGMKNWDWGDYATVDGVIVNGGSGNGNKHMFITAREMARFGLLFLNQGRWNGRQLVPASWVAEATRVHVPADIPWAHPESEIDGRGDQGSAVRFGALPHSPGRCRMESCDYGQVQRGLRNRPQGICRCPGRMVCPWRRSSGRVVDRMERIQLFRTRRRRREFRLFAVPGAGDRVHARDLPQDGEKRGETRLRRSDSVDRPGLRLSPPDGQVPRVFSRLELRSDLFLAAWRRGQSPLVRRT